MRKKSPDKERCLAGIHFKPGQTVPGVDEAALEDISISRQQSRLLQPQQEENDIIIMHSLAAEVSRDGTKTNAPLPQEISLIPGDVLIEELHAAAATSSAKCPPRANSARRASCTASATASLVIFPSPQR